MPTLATPFKQLTTPFDIHPIFHIIPAKFETIIETFQGNWIASCLAITKKLWSGSKNF